MGTPVENKTRRKPSPANQPKNENLVAMPDINGFKSFYNTQTNRFEAQVNGQTVDRASRVELEEAVSRLAAGRRVLVLGRGLRDAILIGRTEENFVFGDGTTASNKVSVVDYDDKTGAEFLKLAEQKTKANKEYADKIEAIDARRAELIEAAMPINFEDVEIVERATRKRRSAADSDDAAPDSDSVADEEAEELE